MEYQRIILTETDIAECLESIDHEQALRYAQLSGPALDKANDGLRRHLRVCDRLEVAPESSAIREIIDYALTGRRILTCGGGQ